MARKAPRESKESREHPGTGALRTPPCCNARHLFCDQAWAGIADKLELSARQAEILRCTLADQTDEEIASTVGVARSTVHTHMERLRERLQAHGRLQLATNVFGACLVWHFESHPPTGCPLRSRLESP
jgi:DNA-binding CsgD family transcriptional regulator